MSTKHDYAQQQPTDDRPSFASRLLMTITLIICVLAFFALNN